MNKDIDGKGEESLFSVNVTISIKNEQAQG